MRKLKWFAVLVVSMLVMSAVAMAADLIPPPPADSPIPGWVPLVLNQVASLPGVGPVLTKVVIVLSAVAGILTALSICALSIFASLRKVMSSTGLDSAEKKTKEISDKIMPYLMYASMFNVQKKAPPVTDESKSS